MNKNYKIYLIGAGNLGLQLGVALKDAGYRIEYVFSRNENKAIKASEILGCNFNTNINFIPDSANIIIIALPDNVLLDVSARLNFKNSFVFHTSGSSEMNILSKTSGHYGVFYPLQTFSAGRSVSFNGIPVLIEASDNKSEKLLFEFASALNAKATILDSEKRKKLHLAAVFACNFSNFMLFNAEKILKDNAIDPALLKPLITETFLKAVEHGAEHSQTGPAKRGDTAIIAKHLEILKNDTDTQKIYELLSRLIMNKFTK